MQLTIHDILEEIENEPFKLYHKNNPDVYERFVQMSFETKEKGFTRFSARGVFQVMRWLFAGRRRSDNFKYNNNYTPYYVRLLEHEYPEFKGFYEKRKIKKKALVLLNP